MRAILCTAFGPPDALELVDLPAPVPSPGQVLLEIDSCAVNYPDALVVTGGYQALPTLPFVPGAEVAGVVAAIGEDVDGFRLGDRVVANIGHGGFAELAAVDSSACVAVPDGVALRDAATVLYGYGTAMHALIDRAGLQQGERLLVLGAGGGVGLAAVEVGHLLGAEVIAAASTHQKLALARERGASGLIDYGAEDLRHRLRELSEGHGVDVVFDPVGGHLTDLALRSMAWRGRYLVIGFASGDIPTIPANLPLLKGCQIVGVSWGTSIQREPELHRAAVETLSAWWQAGRLQPHVSQSLPLEQTGQALQSLLDRSVIGRAVISVRSESNG